MHAEGVTGGIPMAEQAETGASEKKAPARRRAPRTTTAQTHENVAESVAASLAELADAKPATTTRTRTRKVTPEIELPEAGEPASKPATRSRTRKPAAAKSVEPEVASVSDDAAAPAEPAAAEAPAKAPARTRTRRPAAAKAAAETEAAAVSDAAAAHAEPAADESPAKAPARTRNRRNAKATAPVEEAPAPAADEAAEEEDETAAPAFPMTSLLFQEPDMTRAVRTRRTRTPKAEAPVAEPEVAEEEAPKAEESTDAPAEETTSRRRRRGSRGGRSNQAETTEQDGDSADKPASDGPTTRKRTRTRSENNDSAADNSESDSDSSSRRRRRRRSGEDTPNDEVTAPKGSTRLEAKRQRRKEGREAGRRRHSISEAEYLARRESVKRVMLVREQNGLNQIAVLEDDVLVEHYVARHTQVSMVGNVYLGRVQNVLPSMEAAFVDIGKGRNAVLYAGEVNWEAAGLEGQPRRIEQALKSGDSVLVQVTKDPIGHKGARLTAQITLAGRHLVLVPSGAMTGISRKLPEKERTRLKKILKEIVPSEHGVIVRTAAEGATDEQLRADVDRLTKTWDDIQKKQKSTKSAPALLKGEPELAVRVVRDIFNEDVSELKVQGDSAWTTISEYVTELSPELAPRLSHWTAERDIFADHRVDEQLAKGFDRKVFLPSGGSLVIDRTEAMTVIDVNTGKFTGSGGTLEETVTRNNLEAAEEIVRQLRLRDIGGIIVVDFIDMVLEANRDLVLRRLIECLGRDRTRHQVAEVTSLGLVQMTRKRVGQGLVEAFSTTCEACEGRGFITHSHPVEKKEQSAPAAPAPKAKAKETPAPAPKSEDPKQQEVKAALASIAAAAASKHDESDDDAAAPSKAPKTEPEKAEPKEAAAPAAAPEAAPATTEPKPPRRRRVTSSGTITPKSSAPSA